MNALVITLGMWTVVVGGLLLWRAWLERRAGRSWATNTISGVIVIAAGLVLFLDGAGAW